MITFEEFRKDVMRAAASRPRNWRFGQAVFNYIDSEYGVARLVQFEDRVDCFYNDDAVEEFIHRAYIALDAVAHSE